MQELLWLETLIKLASGVLLLVLPGAVIKVLGLPPVPDGFWPRVLGATLVGLGGAAFIEGAWTGSRGIGLAGLILVNLAMAAAIASAALMGSGAPTRRGRLVLWLVVAALVVLVLVEIAYA